MTHGSIIADWLICEGYSLKIRVSACQLLHQPNFPSPNPEG